MATPVTHNDHLQVFVYHLAPEPVMYQNSTDLSFSPTAFTLIAGKHEAVLVDAPATRAQGQEVAEWISHTIPGKQLTAIYVTHGHGDHFFSARSIQQQHPHAKVVATKDCYAHMLEQYDMFDGFWNALFPGKIDGQPLEDVEVLPEDGAFHLEGQLLRAVEVGQGDTYSSTVLHVPSLDLVVGGDVVYGNCHQLFAEDHTPELRALWQKSLDEVAALRPKVVIPSHMRPKDGYRPEHVEETKRYIHTYEEVLNSASSWEAHEKAMKEKFPGRDGSFILRWSSQAPYNAAF